MIAIYNGIGYKYVSNRNSKNIVTRHSTKADESFLMEDGNYFKPIEDSMLSDIYSVKFLINYDCGFDGVSNWWEVSPSDMSGDKIRLRFSNGILPGWNIEEKSVCIKDIDIKDISKAKILFAYKRKENEDVDLKTETEIEVSELKKYLHLYDEKNL